PVRRSCHRTAPPHGRSPAAHGWIAAHSLLVLPGRLGAGKKRTLEQLRRQAADIAGALAKQDVAGAQQRLDQRRQVDAALDIDRIQLAALANAVAQLTAVGAGNRLFASW